jgi:hypothetical protein
MNIACDIPACAASQNVMDEKGKRFAIFDPTYVAPGERPWQEQGRENVRYRATHYPARLLSKAIRQAAARDPALEWDATARTYRLRRNTTPSPSPATPPQATPSDERP